MCVAFVIHGKQVPSLADLQNMESHNPDGAGLGWAEKDRVHWIKGLTAKEVHEWLSENDLPRPILGHFRLSTVGGKRADLCHPFPINRTADVRVAGSSGALLIHNGHWYDWEKYTKMFDELPDGPWSDTRLTAYMMAQFPDEISEIVKLNGGKLAVLNGKGKVRRFGSWTTVKEYKGIYFSNTYWQYTRTNNWRAYDWGDMDDGATGTTASRYYSRPRSLTTRPQYPYLLDTAGPRDHARLPTYSSPDYGKPVEGYEFVQMSAGPGGWYRWVGKNPHRPDYSKTPRPTSPEFGKPVPGFTFETSKYSGSGWYTADHAYWQRLNDEHNGVIRIEEAKEEVVATEVRPGYIVVGDREFDSIEDYLEWSERREARLQPDAEPTVNLTTLTCGYGLGSTDQDDTQEVALENPYATQAGEELEDLR